MSPRSYDTLGHRFIIVFIIIILALLLLSFCSWLSGRWEDAAAQEISASKFDQQLIALDKEALADAYRGRVVHLFDIWMKDESGQPGRALVGVRQARRAYVQAMTEIEKREGK